MRAWAALPVLSMGRMVSSVATTCEARTRSAIKSYSGSARSATSPHQTDCVAREISKPCRIKNVFQPAQWKIIAELASDDVSQQPRSGHAFVDRRIRFRCRFYLRMVAVRLAARAGIFFAYMLDALEAAGNILDLPAFFGAVFFALHAAAGAGALLRAQFINVRGDGEMFEISEGTPPFAALDSPPLLSRFDVRGNISRVDGLALQSFREFQQHLRHLAASEPVRTRPVVPLLITLQRQLQTQILKLQLLILHLQFVGALLLLIGTPLLLVALPQQRADHRFQ